MATHDYVIANASGAAVRADLNNALAAIVSNNSNATEPATMYAYQWWADTSAGQLKLRNAANDDWIVIQELDGTMLMEDGSAASPGLVFASDLDTGLLRPGANSIAISTAGNQRLVVDASGQVGISETAPGTLVEIGGTTPYVTLKNSTQEDTDGGRESKVIFEGEQSGGEITTLAQIDVSHDGTADDQKGKLILSTNDGADGAAPTAALTIDSDQNIDIGSGGITLTAAGSGTFAASVIMGATATGDGTTVASGLLTIRNENAFAKPIRVFRAGTADPSNLQAYIGANGVIANISGTISTISSERRLKENIVPIDANVAWETVKTVPYYSYNFKTNTDVKCYGPIVDEVPAEMVVQPMEIDEVGEVVARSDDEGPIRTYDNGMLHARLYTALQTALTRIETLETQNSSLEARLTALEGGAS